MKVVQVITQLEPGGAQRVAIQLHRGLEARGHEMMLVALYGKSKTDTEGVPVRALHSSRPGRLAAFVLPFRLAWIMRSSKADAVITHTGFSNALGCIGGVLARVPRRVAVQHSPIIRRRDTRMKVDHAFGRLGVYTDVVAVSAATAAGADKLSKRYRRRISVIENAVSLPEPSESVSEVRRAIGLTDDVPLIVHIGRWAAQKGQPLLLEAIGLIDRPVALALVGTGQPQGPADERVRLLGPLGRQEISNLLHAADVFALPSVWEAQPLVLIEAQQAGCTLVISDIPQLAEWAAAGAHVVSARTADAWATTLGRAMDRIQQTPISRPGTNSGVDWMFDAYLKVLSGCERSCH